MTSKKRSRSDNEGRTFLLLRYVLVISAAYLFLFDGRSGASALSLALIATALLSNVIVSQFSEDRLMRPMILGLIICFDITWIALGLWYEGIFGSDIFFL